MLDRWRKGFRSGRGQSGGRRQRQRIDRYFDCTFLSAWGDEKARISSLSPTGCYIDSRTTVPPTGTVIEDITVVLPTGDLSLHGKVLDATRGVGFAVRFTGLDPDTQIRLSTLVRS